MLGMPKYSGFDFVKKNFDRPIIGGATIIPPSLKTKANQIFFQFFMLSCMTPLYC